MRADAGAEEQFGPYLVYERLGVGGMATVHRALERGIDGFERIVALKRLLPHLAADASFIKSFVREAKLASLLSHGNIVQIFECGRVGAQYFISMEYIDGRDIRCILRHARKTSGPPPIHVTVGLVLQLCDALDYAHGRPDDSGHPLGLVHRDVSPSNVLVTSAGQVKVIDFGIAKAQSVQLRTQTGRVKGKLAYMAPEALIGKELDARSDLFAAGIIAHELLTARPLFATKNDYQTLTKIQRGEIMPPSTYNQSCPPELDAIVLRALARDRDERFLRAADLRDELLALRKQYNLQTSERDVAAWIDWAFALDPEALEPGGRAGHPRASSKTEVDVRPEPPERPSRPRRSDEEEAVEIAWGCGDHGNGDPVVLDDVPDVADKHLASASSLGADVCLDLDDLADGIPTPLPATSRPSEASQRAMAAALLARPGPRVKRPTGAMPLRTGPVAPPPAVAPAPRAASARSGAHAVVPGADDNGRGAAMPARPRTTTIPPRILPSSTAQRGASPAAVPAPASPARGLAVVTTPPRSLPSGSITPIPADAPRGRADTVIDDDDDLAIEVANEPAARRAAALGSSPRDGVSLRGVGTSPPPIGGPALPRARNGTAPGQGTRRADTQATGPTKIFFAPSSRFQVDSQITDPGDPADHANHADHGPTFAAEDPEPRDTIVQFPTLPIAEPVVRFREPTHPPPSSTPAPATEPDGRAPEMTPASGLFAEPEPVLDDSEIAPTLHEVPPPAIASAADAARRRGIWRMAAFLVALAVAGAAITAGALQVLRGRRVVVEVDPPAPPTIRKTVGTVELAVAPPDSAITINGQPAHRGTPWTIDLAPGVYQIEIHHDGYMGWLTSIDLAAGEVHPLHVTLEPLGTTIDATVSIGSIPSGLEVVIDGAPAGKTPLKRALPAGAHTIALRRAGAEVWRKTLEAQESAVYELRPTIALPAAGSTEPPGDRPPISDPPAEPAAAPPPAAGEPSPDREPR